MLITRTPLRVSIGGGGTDLPSYYEQFGGFVIAAAINQYIYITHQPHLHRRLLPQVLGSGAGQVRRRDPASDRPRGVAGRTTVGPALEIVSMADIPSGTGLGSSGTFTVGLLRALHAFRRQHVSAEAAGRGGVPDRDRAARTVRSASRTSTSPRFGGLTCFDFTATGRHGRRSLRLALAPTRCRTSKSTS